MPLATVFGLFCLADKYLVTSMKAGIAREVMNWEVGTKDLEDLLEGADEAVVEFHTQFIEALARPIVRKLEKVEKRAVDLKDKVEENSTYEAVKLSEELSAIVGADELVKDEVGSKLLIGLHGQNHDLIFLKYYA